MELSTWGLRIQNFYTKGYYTAQQVNTFVPKFITQKECDFILRKNNEEEC